MSDQERKAPLKLSLPGKLELKKTVETGQVRQSFSHGRSKVVTVDVRKKRSFSTAANAGNADNSEGASATTLKELLDITRRENEKRRLERDQLNVIRATILSQLDGRGRLARAIRWRADELRNQLETAASMQPEQLIIFGPPGTGKSHILRSTYLNKLRIERECVVQTIFHPEYTYGDFVGKLLPLSVPDPNSPGRFTVTYRFYPGHFLLALAKAYREAILVPAGVVRNVALVIDELNRGNCASIFGSIFQLLDRNSQGRSSYSIHLSEMELMALREQAEIFDIKQASTAEGRHLLELMRSGEIVIPRNLSIFATMNTSDDSIYYMDSAFKRRWEWEYLAAGTRGRAGDLANVQIFDDVEPALPAAWKWVDFVDAVNSFILSHSESIRHIEDKQIGYRFIRPEVVNGAVAVPASKIRNKLLFFMWDTVFPRHRALLADAMGVSLRTFADLSNHLDHFMVMLWDFRPAALTADD